MRTYRPQATLFESSEQEHLLTKLGNPLEKLSNHIDWESFRVQLNKSFRVLDKRKGGRPRMDVVMMFKALILQQLYNLSDASLEYQIADRSSFRNFLGITSIQGIPDEKTIWSFREVLTKTENIKPLFDNFHSRLEGKGLIANVGKIVDASIIQAPIQRNTKEENKAIKSGKLIKEWEDNPRKKSQKDVDAKWVKKHGKSQYGYKDHIKVDRKSKLIDNYSVGSASEHDSQQLTCLLTKKDKGQTLYGDSAYRSEEQEAVIKKCKMKSRVHKKGYRNKPLSQSDKRSNKTKSRIRVRVEHVFGQMKKGMGGFEIRSIGMKRAKTQIGLKNLSYNISRAIFLVKHKRKAVIL